MSQPSRPTGVSPVAGVSEVLGVPGSARTVSAPHHRPPVARAAHGATGRYEQPAPAPPRHRECLRVLICDDHEVFRLGLRAVIASVADMVVCGEAADAPEALRLVGEVAPHVVLVGQGIVAEDDLDLVRNLRPHDTEVVMLAECAVEEHLMQSLRAGARGYLTRRVSPSRLLDGIRTVARQEIALDNAVAGHLLQYLGDRRDASPPEQAALVEQLTERQRAVAALVAEGLSNAEIARRLYLSQATVKSHLTIILRRLNVRDRTQLAILVNRHTVTGSP
jgi:DNA-binding NarL/FixJ family response regulator